MSASITDAMQLNGLHRGQTIFIIGAGPQLSRLSEGTFRALETRVTIGLNRTTYKLEPTYFLSAYIGQVMLAQMRTRATVLLHMRPRFEPALVAGVLPLKREIYVFGGTLHTAFSHPEPILLTRSNVALGATHLALILGAKEIVYVGVEQRNAAHFFNYDPNLVHAMREDALKLSDVPFLNIDHKYSTREALAAKLDTEASEEEQRPFYKVSHTDTFKEYFAILRHCGVSIKCAAPKSVVLDAGAEYVELESLLARSFQPAPPLPT